MTKKRTTQQKRGRAKIKAKRKAAQKKTTRREDVNQAAARIVRQATQD